MLPSLSKLPVGGAGPDELAMLPCLHALRLHVDPTDAGVGGTQAAMTEEELRQAHDAAKRAMEALNPERDRLLEVANRAQTRRLKTWRELYFARNGREGPRSVKTLEAEYKRLKAEHNEAERAFRRAKPLNPNETMLGRVVDKQGNPHTIMDSAEVWRLKMVERLQKRIADKVDPRWIGGMHRMTPIPPVPWENGREVFDDGRIEVLDDALVNVYASTNQLAEAEVPVADVHAAMRLLKTSSADLARVVTDISNTDNGDVLDWWPFVRKLRAAVPGLALLGAMWVVGAAYNYYLLKEQLEAEVPWWEAGPHLTIYGTFTSSYDKPRAVRARVKGRGASFCTASLAISP